MFNDFLGLITAALLAALPNKLSWHVWMIHACQDAVALHIISAFRSCLQSLGVLINQCIDAKVSLISMSQTVYGVAFSATTLAVKLMLVFTLSCFPWRILGSRICSLCIELRMMDNNQHMILQV